MKYCTLPAVAALLAVGVLAQPIDDATTVTATSGSAASTTVIVSSVPATTVVPTTTVSASSAPASTIVPTTTVCASSAPASTIVPTTTVSASSAPASTVVPTTSATASSAPASTVVPTTTATASSAPASTASTVAAPSSTPTAVTASFDPVYDNGNNSLDIVACSNTQSLTTATGGKRTFGALPSFPHIGGAFAVTGFASAGCGTCWAVTFENTTVNVLAIDVAIDSFNVAQATLDELTGGKAVQLGRVNVTAVQVAASGCGL